MADVQYWDDTLTDEVQSIRQLIQSTDGLSDRDKASALDRAEKKFGAAQGTKKMYKREIRLVADPKQKRMFENKLTKLTEELGTIASDLKARKGGMQRGELFLDVSRDGNGNEMSGNEAGDMMMNDMNDIQDKTHTSLQNTKKMVIASKEVGQATNRELLMQREQIRTIDDDVMRTEDNLNRADKLIKTFGKRMATDRFIQCFACVNVLLLVGVVVYIIVRKDSGDDESNNGAPENPVGGRLLRGMLYPEEDHDW